MSLNLESLSERLRSRCFRTATAFLMRKYRSSGISGANPCPLRIRSTLLPVTLWTCAIPWESRSTTPIWDGANPFLASLQICSTTCVCVEGVVVSCVPFRSVSRLFRTHVVLRHLVRRHGTLCVGPFIASSSFLHVFFFFFFLSVRVFRGWVGAWSCPFDRTSCGVVFNQLGADFL